MNIFTSGGYSQWVDSESSISRTFYVLSHPVVFLYLLLQASVLTAAGDSLFSFSFVQSYIQVIDHVTGFPRLYAEQSVHANRIYLFFAIALVGTPALVPVLAARISRAEKKNWFALWETKNTLWMVGMLLVAPLLPFITVMGLLIPGDPSFCRGCTTDSLLGMFLIYGVCAPIGIALTTALPFYLYQFVGCKFITYLSRRK